jgi:hypothetical protein
VDGLASYVTAFRRVFRHAVRTGRRGRPRLGVEPGLLIGQVIKRYAKRRVVSVVHRVVRGTAQAIAEVLSQTRTATVINTASIKRLNATFRSALAPLVRRGRAIAHLETTLTAGMYLEGCALLLVPSQPSVACRSRQCASVGRAHTGHGRRLDRPPVDHGRAVALSDPAAPLGTTQATRTST